MLMKVIVLLEYFRLIDWLPDKIYLKLRYYAILGKNLNLHQPLTFDEKLQWLKLFNRLPEYTIYVDKFEVRNHFKNMIGEEYLVPLIGIYHSFDDIDFTMLPNSFILKCTHDSGSAVICQDKDNFDFEKAKKKLEKRLKRNYFYHGREWPYKHIPPKIICEHLLIDKLGGEIKDYKFLCFNGKAKCLYVTLNRNSPAGLNVDFYDLDWQPMPVERGYPRSGTTIEKPLHFDKMVKFAEVLAEKFPFVRVDFYEVNEKLYIGELTLYPGNGFRKFTPDSYDKLFGSWIELPKKQTC